jgi:acetoin utilization protein AcuB
VCDWMTQDPVTVNPDVTVASAYALMKKHRTRYLPVVESDWLVGIVTLGDFWAAVASFEARHDIYEIASHLNCLTVLQIMTHDVLTVTPDTPVEVAGKRMLRHVIGALPVMKEGRLVGILTESDILRLVAEKWSVSDRPSERRRECCDGHFCSGQRESLETSISAIGR